MRQVENRRNGWGGSAGFLLRLSLAQTSIGAPGYRWQGTQQAGIEHKPSVASNGLAATYQNYLAA